MPRDDVLPCSQCRVDWGAPPGQDHTSTLPGRLDMFSRQLRGLHRGVPLLRGGQREAHHDRFGKEGAHDVSD
jgi:hypothetical protein